MFRLVLRITQGQWRLSVRPRSEGLSSPQFRNGRVCWFDMAPATSPATPAIRTSLGLAAAAATPTIRLAVETIPSHWHREPPPSAHPMRATRWLSARW
jgi:hypothetical protein